MKKKELVYYLSWFIAVVVLIVLFLEVATTFSLVENLYSSKFLLYTVYYAAALLIPLVLLSSLLAFRSSKTPEGKKSIKLLVNVGITYAVIKIILVIISSFRLFSSGVF